MSLEFQVQWKGLEVEKEIHGMSVVRALLEWGFNSWTSEVKAQSWEIMRNLRTGGDDDDYRESLEKLVKLRES